MLKRLLEYIIRKRKPEFRFSKNIPLSHFLEIILRNTLTFVRAKKYWFRLKKVGLLFIGSHVQMEGISNISWGKWVQIGRFTKLSALGNCRLSIGNNVTLGSHSSFVVSSSLKNIGKHIIIEDNVGLGDFTHIGGGGGVKIGANTIAGSYLSCHPSNHNFSEKDVLIRQQGVNKQGIVIGANCWIGAKVSILDGVEIGEGSIIAAGAVVNRSCLPGSILAGIPAKVVKMRE